MHFFFCSRRQVLARRMHQLGVADYINEPQGGGNIDSRLRYKTGTTFFFYFFFFLLSPSLICSLLKSEELLIAFWTKIGKLVVTGSG